MPQESTDWLSKNLLTRHIPRTLNQKMEFDNVVRVHDDGSVTDEPDIYAPDLFDGELSGDGWELLKGYSGQGVDRAF